jgi:hypothetical protein
MVCLTGALLCRLVHKRTYRYFRIRNDFIFALKYCLGIIRPLEYPCINTEISRQMRGSFLSYITLAGNG